MVKFAERQLNKKGENYNKKPGVGHKMIRHGGDETHRKTVSKQDRTLSPQNSVKKQYE